LRQHDQSHLGSRSAKSSAMQASGVAMCLSIAEGPFDDRTALFPPSQTFWRLHFLAHRIEQLLSFETFDHPASAAWAKAL
jgi:hypothetical protein